MLGHTYLGFLIVGGGLLVIGIILLLVGGRLVENSMVRTAWCADTRICFSPKKTTIMSTAVRGSRNRRTRYLKEIATMSQLREAQREIALRAEYTGERLADNAAAVFSWDGLLSIVAPPGSVGERIMGGVTTGIAAVHGLSSFIGMWREHRKKRSCDCESRERKPPKRRRRPEKECGC